MESSHPCFHLTNRYRSLNPGWSTPNRCLKLVAIHRTFVWTAGKWLQLPVVCSRARPGNLRNSSYNPWCNAPTWSGYRVSLCQPWQRQSTAVFFICLPYFQPVSIILLASWQSTGLFRLKPVHALTFGSIPFTTTVLAFPRQFSSLLLKPVVPFLALRLQLSLLV